MTGMGSSTLCVQIHPLRWFLLPQRWLSYAGDYWTLRFLCFTAEYAPSTAVEQPRSAERPQVA